MPACTGHRRRGDRMTGDRVDFEWQTLVNPGVRIPAGHHRAHWHRRTRCSSTRRHSSASRWSLAKSSRAGWFVAHNVRSTTVSSAASSGRWRTACARAVDVHGATLALRCIPKPRHNLDAVIDTHDIAVIAAIARLRMPSYCASSGARCAPPGPAKRCSDAMDRASLRATLPPAFVAGSADDSTRERRRLPFLRDGDVAALRQHRQTSCASVCWTISAAGASANRCSSPHRCDASTGRTAGELGARCYEARELREHQPRFQPAPAWRRANA